VGACGAAAPSKIDVGQIINEGAKSKKCKIVENARDIKLKTIVENGIIGKCFIFFSVCNWDTKTPFRKPL
jgi:hypothetical protein